MVATKTRAQKRRPQVDEIFKVMSCPHGGYPNVVDSCGDVCISLHENDRVLVTDIPDYIATIHKISKHAEGIIRINDGEPYVLFDNLEKAALTSLCNFTDKPTRFKFISI